ncbi:hypothetical protein [uncultured Nitrospira sp.]|uniref:hypothetical protein n=1 Tax=uncultured Nitrospira sp. TaxID=157176 RepID=UPI00314061D0
MPRYRNQLENMACMRPSFSTGNVKALPLMEAGFSGKHEKSHTDQEAQIHELHAKIGQLSVERNSLVDASNRLGVRR